MADDIEITVVLTDEEFDAYREWKAQSDINIRDTATTRLLRLLLGQLEETLEEAAFPPVKAEEDDTCPLCIGTGIPQSGPPDVGFCSACKGTGVKKAERDPDDYDPPDDYDY